MHWNSIKFIFIKNLNTRTFSMGQGKEPGPLSYKKALRKTVIEI